MLKIVSCAIFCLIIGFDLFLVIYGIIEVIKSGRAPIQYSNKPTKNPQRIIDEMDCVLADNMRRRDQQIQYQQQQQQEQMQMQQDMFWNQF